jgi:PBP1b-binding outer membrane lipoprotein LpoB
MKTSTLKMVIVSVVVSLMLGCTGETTQLNPDELSNVERGAGMTSQDFRSVAQRLARSLIVLPQIQNAATPPKVAFIRVSNNSDEYINGDMFLNKMRTDLIKYAQGKIVFLDRSMIEAIEKENRDKARSRRTSGEQQTPYGADFFLTGTIESIRNVAGRGKTTYLRYSFRLTDADSSAIVWEDDYEIKRYSKLGVVYSD